jgi:hypothetical protein
VSGELHDQAVVPRHPLAKTLDRPQNGSGHSVMKTYVPMSVNEPLSSCPQPSHHSKQAILDCEVTAVLMLVTVYHAVDCDINNNNPRRYSSDEPWPAEQPPLALFPDCSRRYWVDMWSAHRIPQLHFQLSKPDRYFFIQVTTQFIRSRG